MNWGQIGTVGAPVLIALFTLIGVFFKRRTDRQTAVDARAQAAAELKAKSDQAKADRAEVARIEQMRIETTRAQAAYDQMQEDLEATRKELRTMQADLASARNEVANVWQQMFALRREKDALRREKDADEAHIADWRRWAENGSVGPIPVRRKV